MTEASKETILERVPYIRYSVWFKKGSDNTQALIDLGSEVNAINPTYAKKLGLCVWQTDVRAQRFDGSHLETFEIVIASFLLKNKLGKVQFFRETFLLADTQIKVILGMRFLTLNNADIRFAERELVWKTYSAVEALPTTQRVEIINKKEFTIAALNEEDETFVVHIAALSVDSNVHPSRQAQIALLDVEEVIIPSEYTEYTDVFSSDSAAEPPKHTDINDYSINLIDDKQPPYGPIYSLRPVELETLKTYIEINLANNFIRPSKSPTGASILFIHKKNSSLWLYVDYQGLNNLTIKNWYPLPPIGKSPNRLGRAKHFTQLDLTNAYYQMRIREGNE